ncbi:MAG: glycosyltransferase, partial [Acidimicrobiales bacterium]
MVDRVLVIIPALNEEATVAGVVASVSDHLDADILVVDDGSRDATAE